MTGNRTEPKLGMWWAPCCLLDLEEITTEEQLEDARAAWEDAFPWAGCWATEEEARAALQDTPEHPSAPAPK